MYNEKVYLIMAVPVYRMMVISLRDIHAWGGGINTL